jgi:hypothetical protein
VARLAHETEVFAGVIFEHERKMNAPLRILLDRLDDGGFQRVRGPISARPSDEYGRGRRLSS